MLAMATRLMSWPIGTAVLSAVAVYSAARILYNLYLHPLRRFPGPLLARSTILTTQIAALCGRQPFWIHRLHQQYGPVVRITPNQLSFVGPEAWKDIYGHKTIDSRTLEKDRLFYGPDLISPDKPGLLRADQISHARQRKLVSHAFSDKALREQEDLLKGYAELLVHQLKAKVADDATYTTDLRQWYNCTTFDIMADLTFGEALHCLDNGGRYTAWMRAMFAGLRVFQVTQMLMQWGLLGVLETFVSASTLKKLATHIRRATEQVDKRLERKTGRPDIWTFITRHSAADPDSSSERSMTRSQMHSLAAVFMAAGTETTATELAGVTFFLLRDPLRMERLVKEIRTAFPAFDDLTMIRLAKLDYLNACVEEGLRIYPPVPVGLPRVTPEQGAVILGEEVPPGVTVAIPQYATYHSPRHFKDPDAFVPERWLPEGAAEYGSDVKAAHNPFSYGPRNCLGKNLAYHELRLVLASVLWHFELTLCDESARWDDQNVYLLWEQRPLMVQLAPVHGPYETEK